MGYSLHGGLLKDGSSTRNDASVTRDASVKLMFRSPTHLSNTEQVSIDSSTMLAPLPPPDL